MSAREAWVATSQPTHAAWHAASTSTLLHAHLLRLAALVGRGGGAERGAARLRVAVARRGDGLDGGIRQGGVAAAGLCAGLAAPFSAETACLLTCLRCPRQRLPLHLRPGVRRRESWAAAWHGISRVGGGAATASTAASRIIDRAQPPATTRRTTPARAPPHRTRPQVRRWAPTCAALSPVAGGASGSVDASAIAASPHPACADASANRSMPGSSGSVQLSKRLAAVHPPARPRRTGRRLHVWQPESA